MKRKSNDRKGIMMKRIVCKVSYLFFNVCGKGLESELAD